MLGSNAGTTADGVTVRVELADLGSWLVFSLCVDEGVGFVTETSPLYIWVSRPELVFRRKLCVRVLGASLVEGTDLSGIGQQGGKPGIDLALQTEVSRSVSEL